MSSEHSTVLFEVPARTIRRRELQQFAQILQQKVAKGRDFVCLVTSDEKLRELNRQFRRKDSGTDVLSFPSGDLKSGSAGEMAISFERAKAQALEFGHSAAEEIRILMLHGLLHLLGMDHEKDNGQMLRAERKWRKYFDLPAGLIERVPR